MGLCMRFVLHSAIFLRCQIGADLTVFLHVRQPFPCTTIIIVPFVRGDFQVKFSPDGGDEDNNCSVFLLLEKACFELAEVSYKMNSVQGLRQLVNGRECLYKNFLYSRMLWGKCIA